MRPKVLVHAVICALVFAAALPMALWAAPKYTILHGFTGGKDGGGLWGSLLLDGKGNVYGTTTGTVFELTPGADGSWHLTTLHRFHYPGKGGAGLTAGLIFDSVGNLYGTAQTGGAHGYGVVFELSPDAERWKETVLYAFRQPPGPYAGVIMDGAGDLYGTAGVAYELTHGSWNELVLHHFGKGNDGSGPVGLVMDSIGNLFGTTQGGGGSSNCDDGCGTVYELSPTPDGKWKETIVHRFQARWDGALPGVGALVLDAAGNVYGTANGGGTGAYGVIFRMSRGPSGRWRETVLYDIPGGREGDEPSAGVVMDKAGNLYGTTIAGGDPLCGCGVVYELAPGADGKWVYTVLHTFVGSDGAEPDANLILDDKGNLYGTTATGGPGGAGVAFELTP